MMSSLRGKITGVGRHDIDGQSIPCGDVHTAVETVTLVLTVDYINGDLADLIGHSLAIVPHGKADAELLKMTNQREQQRSRWAVLEVDTAPRPLEPHDLHAASGVCRRCGRVPSDINGMCEP